MKTLLVALVVLLFAVAAYCATLDSVQNPDTFKTTKEIDTKESEPCPNGEERDCAGVCGGKAFKDCKGVCGGKTFRDCAGVCGGTTYRDCAGECGGKSYKDCAGVCGGKAFKDSDGNCVTAEELKERNAKTAKSV